MIGLEPHERWNEIEWKETLRTVWREINPILESAGMKKLHMQDLQNCLCEFDKYERTRLGEGRPKQKFVPTED